MRAGDESPQASRVSLRRRRAPARRLERRGGTRWAGPPERVVGESTAYIKDFLSQQRRGCRPPAPRTGGRHLDASALVQRLVDLVIRPLGGVGDRLLAGQDVAQHL